MLRGSPLIRTHEAGTLRADHAGQIVTLSGWVGHRRDHGGVIFVDLRDASGVAQVVFREGEMAERAHQLRAEYCVKVVGEVAKRPEGNENPELATGAIEVLATGLEVLSESAPLPFPLDEHLTVGEEIRLKHRYLDLRRPGPARAMRLRSEANRITRAILHEERFVEVETPTLTRSTPEGARDFLVPARLRPGSWYALPQSPQLFKQLLMVGGLERYYQIARCYRDEDFRADRQPEFTQLDIEMSFVEQDEITELTEYFAESPFRVFRAPYVGSVVMPGGASQPRRQLDAWQDWARQRGGKGLAYVLVGEDGTLGGPVAKNLSEAEREGLAKAAGAEPGDCVFFAAGPRSEARALLGAARLEVGRRCGLLDESAWSFVWVVDAPLFEEAEAARGAGDIAVGGGRWTAVHHAFTSPTPEWTDRFEEDPGNALAYAYDIVCNGVELGGGSIRIHRADVQERVFKVMGIEPAEAREKFGFLLEGLRYGAPPHGGIAIGWDRTVMVLGREDSIREVIAFPKSGGGYDPLTGAPAPITPEQRKEAGVDTKAAAQ
jgi:aspartyl-tRNA synthetase